MEPVSTAADTEIADAALNPWIGRCDVNGIAAAGAAGAVGGDPVRIDFRASLHIRDGAADIFGLPFGHHPAAIVAFAVAPAAIVKTETSITRGAKLFEHHDVVLGVFEAEKAGSLNNSSIGLALIRVR